MPITKFSLSEQPEHAILTVDVGPDQGDSTRTVLRFDFNAGSWDAKIEQRKTGGVSSVEITLHGMWEREGMAHVLEQAAKALKEASNE